MVSSQTVKIIHKQDTNLHLKTAGIITLLFRAIDKEGSTITFRTLLGQTGLPLNKDIIKTSLMEVVTICHSLTTTINNKPVVDLLIKLDSNIIFRTSSIKDEIPSFNSPFKITSLIFQVEESLIVRIIIPTNLQITKRMDHDLSPGITTEAEISSTSKTCLNKILCSML